MITIAMKKRLHALEVRKNIKRKLPLDCKNLFDHYLRDSITTRLARITDNRQIEPLKLAVEEDQNVLSHEAQEFISLTAEGQVLAVEHYRPAIRPEKTTEVKQNILKKLNLFTWSVGFPL